MNPKVLFEQMLNLTLPREGYEVYVTFMHDAPGVLCDRRVFVPLNEHLTTLAFSWRYRTRIDVLEAGLSATLSSRGVNKDVLIPWDAIVVLKNPELSIAWYNRQQPEVAAAPAPEASPAARAKKTGLRLVSNNESEDEEQEN